MDRRRDIKDVYSSREEIEYRGVNYLIENSHRPIVIAGNGPSLADTDNRRIPGNAVIMRINNFFFEDKYYLGRKFDYLYIAGSGNLIRDYLNTLMEILNNNEYSVDIYMGRRDRLGAINPRYFPYVDISKAFVCKKSIADFMTKIEISSSAEPTSGMLAIFAAICFGYTEIYLTGVDLYSKNAMYSFDVGANHARLVGIDAGDSGYVQNYHSRSIDIKALLFAKSIEGVKLKSLSPGSPVEKYVEAGPIFREEFQEIELKTDHIRDFILVNHIYMYNNVYYRYKKIWYAQLLVEYILISRSVLFNRYWYKRNYDDVARSDVDSVRHYLMHGCAEGRNPSPDFNTRRYYERNPDVAEAGMNALVHYIRYGEKEGRKIS